MIYVLNDDPDDAVDGIKKSRFKIGRLLNVN